ncbi:energy-coupling factor transporter transmembrane component T [Bacillus sp. JJ1562]|uniref:energy-coupling factor transporter transmembrane component T n=1 Tax=Bacillus sp. JJ1562 TaxID=3122960 RepID=UPI003001CB48
MYSDFIKKFIDYQTYDNWFLNLNPLTKLNFFLALGILSMVFKDWKVGLVICLFYYLTSLYVKKFKPFNSIFSKVIIFIGVWTIFLRLITTDGETVFFEIFGWKWTVEALENGLDMAFFLLGFSGAIILFFVTTPMRDLMYSLEKKGVSHAGSYVMLSSFQTIADLRKNLNTIFESQKARGIETEGSLFQRFKAFFPVLSPLMLGAISSTEEKNIAMNARAFSVNTKHSFLRELRPMPSWEKGILVLINVGFIAAICLKIYQSFFV